MSHNFRKRLSFRPPTKHILGTIMAWLFVPVILLGAFLFSRRVIGIWSLPAIAIIVILALSMALSSFTFGLRCLARGVVVELGPNALVVRKALSGRVAGIYRYENTITTCRWGAGIETAPRFFLLYASDGDVENWEDAQIVPLPYVRARERLWRALNARIKYFAPRQTEQERKELQRYARIRAARYNWTIWLGLALVLLSIGSLFAANRLNLSLEWTLGAILTPVIVGALLSAISFIQDIV